jgi:hypothetical protein
MLTKGKWLARQLQELEEQVKAERHRLNDERKQQALCAVIQLSLPELLGEVRPDETEQEPRWEPPALRMH